MSIGNGGIGAALGGLILALCVIGSGHAENERHGAQVHPKPQLQPVGVYQPSCNAPKDNTDATYCQQVEATAATKEQAKWAIGQFWVNVAGVAAVVWTLRYTAVAANAARAAAEAIPVLERPYLYAVLDGDTIAEASNAVGSNPQSDEAHVRVGFFVRNYGKTPATILRISAEVAVNRPLPYARDKPEDFFLKEVMLGEGAASERREAVTSEPINADDIFQMFSGESTLFFSGWIIYRDIWGKVDTVQFGWKYNARLQEWMTLEN